MDLRNSANKKRTWIDTEFREWRYGTINACQWLVLCVTKLIFIKLQFGHSLTLAYFGFHTEASMKSVIRWTMNDPPNHQSPPLSIMNPRLGGGHEVLASAPRFSHFLAVWSWRKMNSHFTKEAGRSCNLRQQRAILWLPFYFIYFWLRWVWLLCEGFP